MSAGCGIEMPLIPTQEAEISRCREFKAIIVYIVSARLARTIERPCLSKAKKKRH